MRYAALLVAVGIVGCGERIHDGPTIYEAEPRDGSGRHSVEFPAEIPRASFQFTFRRPDGGSLVSTFNYASSGSLDCYFSRGMPTICVGPTTASLPAEISDGSAIRRERRADLTRYIVADTDFTDLRNGQLVEFGVLNDDGSVYQSYRKTP